MGGFEPGWWSASPTVCSRSLDSPGTTRFLRGSSLGMLSGSLIGREPELSALERAFGGARLVTVTGLGGCGKTRLVDAFARRVSSGVEWSESVVVDLAAVGCDEHVVDALVRALGARERAGRSPMEVAIECLTGREVLLVLDNCEHVAGAVAGLVGVLFDAVSGVWVLAASRGPLGVVGEVVFTLAPLGLPERGGGVGAVVRSDAGRLFVERAAAADPGFALTPAAATAVVAICHELAGVPLALVLAAARVGTVSLGEIAEGLARHGRLAAAAQESVVARHGSLRASLEWSWRLLNGPERVLLRGVCVFADGWTCAAAHAVALPHASESEVRGLLGQLEAKGLVMAARSDGRERWSLLGTVQEYAAEQLALEGEEQELRDRHLAWFRALATEADGVLLERGGHELIDEETPNLRLAFARALQRDHASALVIAAALVRHWVLNEHFEEGRGCCADALAVADDRRDPGRSALLRCGAGLIGALTEDYAIAAAHTQAGVALLAGLDDPAFEARCLQLSGMAMILTGLDLPAGRASVRRAVELLRGSGDRLGLAWALVNVAMAEGICDRFDDATNAYEEFVAISGAAEHPRLRTWAELAVAWVQLTAGSPKLGLAHADRALALEGERPSMTHFIAICHRVHALALLGRAPDAIDEAEDALRSASESGAVMARPAIEMAFAVAELIAGKLAGAQTHARTLLKMPQAHTVALMREVLAQAALARGDAHQARLHGLELASLAQQTGSPRLQALADHLCACAAIVDGDCEQGRERLHAALVLYAELGLQRGAVDALEELALLDVATGDRTRAARLAGAAAAARTRLGCQPLARTQTRLAATRGGLVDSDGQSAWAAAWGQGQALSIADAIAYAHRGRGPRDRPATGWTSLTPAEAQVAQLAAAGMSNPEIGSQLFMSRGTVKMHLSSTYTKLKIANRTELARVLALRPLDPGAAALSAAISTPRG
jgi:predicted ATPase/DNA-binding CsgD family transcriptional regulator